MYTNYIIPSGRNLSENKINPNKSENPTNIRTMKPDLDTTRTFYRTCVGGYPCASDSPSYRWKLDKRILGSTGSLGTFAERKVPMLQIISVMIDADPAPIFGSKPYMVCMYGYSASNALVHPVV